MNFHTAPDRHPEGCGLRGPPDRGQVHVPRDRQRLLGEASGRPQDGRRPPDQGDPSGFARYVVVLFSL